MMAALQSQAVQSMWADEYQILSLFEKVKKSIDNLSKSSMTNQEILDITNRFKREHLADLSESQRIDVIEVIDMIIDYSLIKKRDLRKNGEIPQEMI